MQPIGIIGGSGLDDPDILENAEDRVVETKFGEPSGPLRLGTIGGVQVAILGRHGRSHTLPPGEVPYRANISALAEFGCKAIVSTTAVGSLRIEIERGDLVILDQFLHILLPTICKEHITGLDRQIRLDLQELIPIALRTTDLDHLDSVPFSEVSLSNRAVGKFGTRWNGQSEKFLLWLVPF